VECVVLGVDVERQRIALGIKQLEDDPFDVFLANASRGSRVDGKVLAPATGEIRPGLVSSSRLKYTSRRVSTNRTTVATVFSEERTCYAWCFPCSQPKESPITSLATCAGNSSSSVAIVSFHRLRKPNNAIDATISTTCPLSKYW